MHRAMIRFVGAVVMVLAAAGLGLESGYPGPGGLSIQPAVADGVVGDGTAGSCDEDALDDALDGGGLVTFNCHPDDLPIVVTSQKVIAFDIQIDGGNLITLDGQDSTRIFVVNTGISLDLTGITLTGGKTASTSIGGAIYNDGGTLTLTDTTLSGNTALFGGGIYNSGGAVTLTDSTLNGNTAVLGGGGISINDGAVTLTNSTLSSNTADFGGGIFNTNTGTLTLTNSTLRDNTAGGFYGGGIYNNGGPVTLTDSTLSSNTADFGGGIYNRGGAVTVTNSTLSDNTAADDDGGGIYNFTGAVTLTNSTLSSNTADFGGAIFNNSGTLTLTNSTLSGNAAIFGGGISNTVGSIANLQNTIVANSTSGGNCAGDSTTSQGGNLSDDASCNFTQSSDLNATEDGLGLLADNGGPTQTHLPQPGSAAIDNGLSACLDEDQRGVSRPQGVGCDIGAVEVIQGATYPLCVSSYTGVVSSPLSSGCGTGMIEITPFNQTFCIDTYTGRLLYLFGRPCTPPRRAHVLPDDGDLLTCVNRYTRANRWVLAHGQCSANEVPNTIPAAP